MKPRIFISSVVEGLEEYRDAGADGIESAGAVPVMVERMPSLATSPRNACLDGVRSSDACVVVIGQRGGWTTPSGALAVEEEFEEAERRGIPVVVFLIDTPRDGDAQRLARRVSDYVSGRFRRTIRTPHELREGVTDAIRELSQTMHLDQSDPQRVLELVRGARVLPHEPVLRVAFLPERADELLSPDQLESDELIHGLFEIAHRRDVAFFAYDAAKETELTAEGSVRIDQIGDAGRGTPSASLTVAATGECVLDSSIVPENPSSDIGSVHLVLIEKDVVATIRRALSMLTALLDQLDPHERFVTAWFAAALVGMQMQYLAADYPTGGTPVRMGDGSPVLAEETPRRVSRPALRAPQGEIDRIMALFRRKLSMPGR